MDAFCQFAVGCIVHSRLVVDLSPVSCAARGVSGKSGHLWEMFDPVSNEFPSIAVLTRCICEALAKGSGMDDAGEVKCGILSEWL